MSKALIETHDVLERLSIIKNCLALLLEEKNRLSQDSKGLLDRAYLSNQELIDLIKAGNK